MKIITLNIMHGGGKRVDRILEYLKEQKADIIVLTEFRQDERGELLREGMSANGFNHFASSAIAPKQNSVCIFARLPFETRTLSALSETDRHRVVAVTFNNLDVVGVYFAQREEKRSLFECILSGSFRPQSRGVLLIGDINTGLHYQDEAGATFVCSDLFGTLPSVGLIDSWRTRNPHERTFSWYSNVGNGFRIDHVFCTRSADDRIVSVHYDHCPRESRITDHSALLVELADQ